MRVAISLFSGVSYGGLTYFQKLIPALATVDQKNEYHLFVPQGHLLVRQVRQDNFIFHECMRNNQSALKRFLWEQFVFPRELKKHKADVLFTAKNLNVFLAPCKTIISLRNMEPLAYHEYDNDWKLNVASWLKWQLTKWSVRKSDHIVAVSEAVKDRLLDKFSGIEKRVSMVYNGNPAPQLAGARGGPILPFILSASKFVAYANQLNLLRGYSQLVEKNSDTPPLWFAGGVHDKKYFKKVQQFVKDNKLEARVKFLGLVPHDKLLELMRQAWAFVFSSTLESCPHTLIEAMACGVPIATSTTPPMPEICADAAVYFNPHNPADIAQAVERVIRDEAVREDLRRKGPTRAQNFTWEKTARGLLYIFQRI